MHSTGLKSCYPSTQHSTCSSTMATAHGSSRMMQRSCSCSCPVPRAAVGSVQLIPRLPLSEQHQPSTCSWARHAHVTSSRAAPSWVAAAGKQAPKGFGVSKNKKVDAAMDPTLPCPCGSGATYEACCQPFHNKAAKPANAEQLLRSRYTAYALKNADYIADTTHTSCEEWTGTRASYLLSVRETQKRAKWLGLTIDSQEQGEGPNETFIKFKAAYALTDDKAGKRQERLERSHFKKDKTGQWYYHGSDLLEDPGAEQVGPTQMKFPTFGMPTLPEIKF